ncbi:MAG: ArsR/SmtB family transcription factor [Bacteroidales bacterium]
MALPKKENFSSDDIQLAEFARALSHPARILILRNLAEIESCYFNKISDEIPLADSTVSQHLAELKKAGLIQGKIEPPRIKYCININNWERTCELFSNFLSIRIKKYKKTVAGK